jgi:hypothetical protein
MTVFEGDSVQASTYRATSAGRAEQKRAIGWPSARSKSQRQKDEMDLIPQGGLNGTGERSHGR